MLWLLLLMTGAALSRRPSPPPKLGDAPVPSGHPELTDIELVEVETYTVMVGRDPQGTWDWRAWLTTVFESRDDIEGMEEGAGFDLPTLEEAKADAVNWVRAELGRQSPAVGDDQPAEPVALTRRGVRVSGDCRSVAVTDIEQWIAYASEVVSDYDAEDPNAYEVMARALGPLFPECVFTDATEIRGRSWAETAERVQATIAKIQAGELLAVEPVEDVVAARIVGMSVPAVEGARAEWVTAANGDRHAVVAKPREGGGASWWAWKGPRRRWEEAASVGVAENVDSAMEAGREWVANL